MSDLLSPHILAELVTAQPLRRDTYAGWTHHRMTRNQFVPAPRLTADQWGLMTDRDKSHYDLHRTFTHVNMPLQETPMALKVSRLVNRRIRNNALKKKDATLSGVMVSGWGYQGKTATVCEVASAFEDAWLDIHGFRSPDAVRGTLDLHAPVAYVQTPVTATPKSTCQAMLNFFDDTNRSMTLPQLVHQVAQSLEAHGVKALILDDITRLRMHRADDQDTLDLMRAFMSLNVTLILVGVDIAGSGLLREARWNAKKRQWVFPPSEQARVFGLEVTQTERRFDLIELEPFRYSTSPQIQAFIDHLGGIEENLRLLESWPGMLTDGGMPEYLMRRTGGVVGLLQRLIEDGAQEAMDSGQEFLDESLLDEIVISLDDPSRDPAAGEVPSVPVGTTRTRTKKVKRGRNTTLDDRGPAAHAEGA
ncbi:AAA family ATPase [Streptomyces anulatus]|uniref:AAA family ATPase n=1 Tax=Streptomyces anulatus TaxID=1892 RepID=UPI0036BC0A12